MGQEFKARLKVMPGGHHKLEAMHDRIMNQLDTHEKRGIRQLLERNNESCRKLLLPYFKSAENLTTVMTALSGILEIHSKECYTIGYLDCAVNGKQARPEEISVDPECT